MNTLYCASCAYANRYEIVKPKLCQSCNKPVEGIFIPTSPIAVATRAPISAPPARHPYPAPTKSRSVPLRANLRGGERTPILGLPVEETEQVDFESGDDHVDGDETYARGQELAQTISADDFMVGSLEVEGAAKTFNFGDLVREGQRNGGAVTASNKAPKQRRRK